MSSTFIQANVDNFILTVSSLDRKSPTAIIGNQRILLWLQAILINPGFILEGSPNFKTMVEQYKGQFPFDNESVSENATDSIGVYYCGEINSENALMPVHYVGMSGESIKDRLQAHLRDDNWPDATHFGFENCSTEQEAEEQEAKEIERLKPKYNDQGE